MLAMMKMEIVLDEDKIRAEGEYEVELIKYNVCRPFDEKKLCKVETFDDSIVYCDADREEDFTSFLGLMLSFAETKWFVRYVKKWMWYRDGNREDILENFSKSKVGAFA